MCSQKRHLLHSSLPAFSFPSSPVLTRNLFETQHCQCGYYNEQPKQLPGDFAKKDNNRDNGNFLHLVIATSRFTMAISTNITTQRNLK